MYECTYYSERERERERETGRQAGRQADRQTDRQIEGKSLYILNPICTNVLLRELELENFNTQG